MHYCDGRQRLLSDVCKRQSGKLKEIVLYIKRNGTQNYENIFLLGKISFFQTDLKNLPNKYFNFDCMAYVVWYEMATSLLIRRDMTSNPVDGLIFYYCLINIFLVLLFFLFIFLFILHTS